MQFNYIPDQFSAEDIESADTIINAALQDAEIDAIGRDAARKITWLVTGTMACACGMLNDKEFTHGLGLIRDDLAALNVPEGRRYFVQMLTHVMEHWATEPVVPADLFDARMARCLKNA